MAIEEDFGGTPPDRRIARGGPAFPAPVSSYSSGMTMRDYFAASAITAVMETRFMAKASGRYPIIAEEAYAIADALLAERSKAEPSK